MPKIGRKTLLDCSEEKSFWTNDGQILKNINELPDALKQMDAGTFAHHVNAHKNDFANWVEHVYGEQKLAADLRGLQSKAGVIRKLQHHL